MARGLVTSARLRLPGETWYVVMNGTHERLFETNGSEQGPRSHLDLGLSRSPRRRWGDWRRFRHHDPQFGNGFAWSVAWLVSFVLWPFVAVALQQRTGSFADAFLLIPVVMVLMGVGVWLFVPDYAGKDLDAIGV